MKALGQHLLIELYGCKPETLDDLEWVRDTMSQAADLVGASIIGDLHHRFEPQGLTVVVAIAESHLSIHTWPEYGYAAVDIFTCSESLIPGTVTEFIVERLQAIHISTVEIKRGILRHPSVSSVHNEDIMAGANVRA